TDIVKKLNLIEGNTVVAINDVLEWLHQPENQSQKNWPQILGILCQSWFDLLQAASQWLATLHSLRVQQLSSTEGKAIDKLQIALSSQLITLHARNRTVIEQLNELCSAAQNRGMVWIIDEGGTGYLWVASDLHKGDAHCLNHELRRVAVT